MNTLPVLDALHTASFGSAALRRDIRDATDLIRSHTGLELVPVTVHLNLRREVDAVGFDGAARLRWCGLSTVWPLYLPYASEPRWRVCPETPDHSGWSRDELLTALAERPDPADPLHLSLRGALGQRGRLVLLPTCVA